jgi:NitT/TauT family transport system permease protein
MSDMLASAAADGGARMLGWLRTLAVAAVAIAAIGIAWHYVVIWAEVPPYIMPTPQGAWEAYQADEAKIWGALVYTLRSAALGLAVATLVALILAALFTASDTATRAVLPIVIGLRTAPVLAIAPILIMVFGRGLGTSIVVVVIVGFFPIMVNAMKGFRAARRNVLELMHVCGASPVQTFVKVRFPYALPFIFTGLRAASASAILSAMLAEWLSGAPGLGTMILEAASYREIGLLWASVVVGMAMAFAIFLLTTAAEKQVLTWSH